MADPITEEPGRSNDGLTDSESVVVPETFVEALANLIGYVLGDDTAGESDPRRPDRTALHGIIND